jgi:hypothetical protein
MKVIASDYAVAGVLKYLYDSITDDRVHSFTLENLANMLRFNLNDGFTDGRVEKIVKIINSLGAAEFLDDPFADPILQIESDRIRKFLEYRNNFEGVYRKSWDLGLDWLRSAYKKDVFWGEFDKEPFELGSSLVPVADGFVTLNHNSADYKQATSLIDDFLEKLRDSNDVGEMTAEDIDLAIVEVQSVKAELQQPSVAMPAFGENVRSIFGWIAKQAAGSIVGALALAALTALFNLMVFF